MLTACGDTTPAQTSGNTSYAPSDPSSTPSVENMDTTAAYDQGAVSIIPGYQAISWIDLSDVRFEDRYYEDVQSYLLFPKFGPNVKALDKKPITLAGFVIQAQADSGVFVLSANPLASCFFCGAAGPESVVQLNLEEGQRDFKTDEFITFKGTLQLNDSDIDQLNYILNDAAELTDIEP